MELNLKLDNLLNLTDKRLESLFEMPGREARLIIEGLILRGFEYLHPKYN